VLDDERALVAERLRLDVVLDEFSEASSAVDVGAASLRLRAAEYPEAHGVRLFQLATGEKAKRSIPSAMSIPDGTLSLSSDPSRSHARILPARTSAKTITTISGASDGTEHTADEFVVTVGAEMTRWRCGRLRARW
jgi:hypothetical protein